MGAALLPEQLHAAYLQMLEVAYLLYCRHYFYPVLVLSLFAISIVALSRALRRTRKKMMALVNEVRLTPMVVGGWVRGVSSHRLLPGDVVVLQPGKALFDMVLLQGNCLCVESMLTGEVRPADIQSGIQPHCVQTLPTQFGMLHTSSFWQPTQAA